MLAMPKLFRLQKYKKFESNSQQSGVLPRLPLMLFRLQKYKKFESNSQLAATPLTILMCCFDCKSTKNLRAIHNYRRRRRSKIKVVSTAKVQKI